MKDEDLKLALTGLAGCVSALAEKQSLLCELLSIHLPGLSPEHVKNLRQSGETQLIHAKKLQVAIELL